MQCSQSSFVANCRICAIIEQKVSDFEVILFNAVMERSLLTNIMILLHINLRKYFEVDIRTIFNEYFDKIHVLNHDCNVEWGASVDIPRIYLSLFVYELVFVVL